MYIKKFTIPDMPFTVHQIDRQAESCVTRSKFIFIYS